jgi:hypothetical protein
MNTRNPYPDVEIPDISRPSSSLTEPMCEVQRSRSWVPPTAGAPAR